MFISGSVTGTRIGLLRPRAEIRLRTRSPLLLLPPAYLLAVLAWLFGASAVEAVAIVIVATCVVLPLASPVAMAYGVILTAWVPFEELFGERRELFTFAGGGVNLSGVRLLAAAVGLTMALGLLARRGAREMSVPQPVRVVLALYAGAIVWLTLSLGWSDAPSEGIRSVAKLVLPALVFVVLLADAHVRGRDAATRRIVTIVGATILAGTFYGAIGVFARDLLPAEPSSVSAWYGWAGWSLFGFLLAMGGVFAMSLARFRLHRDALPLAVIALAQVPLCLKRITVAAAIAGLALIAALPGPRRWFVLVPGLVAIVVLVSYPPLVERMLLPGKTFGDVITEGPSQAIRFEGRERLWSNAVGDPLRPAVVIGNGAGGSTVAATRKGDDFAPQEVHSEIVRTVYDGGFIGAFLLFGAYIAVGVGLAVAGWRSASTRVKGYTYGAAGAVVVFLITSLTDNTLAYYTVGCYLAALVAAAVLVADKPQGEAT